MGRVLKLERRVDGRARETEEAAPSASLEPGGERPWETAALDELDFTSLAYQDNPAPWLHRIRCESPVFLTRHGHWLLTRYVDVKRALRDPRFSSDWSRLRGIPTGNSTEARNRRLVFESFNMKDPPAHTRIRALVNLAFAGLAAERRRGRIEALARELLERRAGGTDLCVVEDFGFHLPIIVAAEMIGIPAEDRLHFRSLFEDAELLFLPDRTPEQEERGRRALAEEIRYVRALVAERRHERRDDLISELVRARTPEGALTEDEIVSAVVTIFTAAGTTTERLISSGILALLQHPDQLSRLRAEPRLIDSAVEEILRWHHPDQATSTPRWTTEAVRVGNVILPQHATVRLSLGAANRDPEHFPDPDRFDITRAPNRHLAFGRGEHFCLGATLARMEARIALRTIIEQHPQIELLTRKPHRDPRRPDRYAKILVRLGEPLPASRRDASRREP